MVFKNNEGCGVLPLLHVNKLACYSYTNAGRRHTILRSETLDLFMA